MNFRSCAIVLRGIDFGESDRILSVYSREHGKISVFVPGARRSKKRSAQALDLFCVFEGDFHSRRNSTMLRLGDFHYQDIGMAVRRDLPHIISGCLYLECLYKLTIEMDPHPDLFDTSVLYLQHLATAACEPRQIILPYFLLRLLSGLGFLPELRHCVRCERSIEDAAVLRYHFIPWEGGIVCKQCLPSHPYAKSIDVAALRAIQGPLQGKMPVERIRLQPHLATQLLTLILDMMESVSGRELKCRQLLYMMQTPADVTPEAKEDTTHETPPQQETSTSHSGAPQSRRLAS